MAQSSNYKQYSRSTRVLTEESGFAGGMMWTDNNIDETHLKAIVNCDYDETTGVLKTRDPFVLASDSLNKEMARDLEINLLNWRLLCVHTICAYDEDNTLLAPGKLYVFTTAKVTYVGCGPKIKMDKENVLCIYETSGEYYKCTLDISETVTLHNIVDSNIFLNYDNQLYSLGSDTANVESWLQVYQIKLIEEGVYSFKQLPYVSKDEPDIKSKIDAITLLEASISGFNAARGKNTFKYSGVVDDSNDPYILGVYLTDEEGNILISPYAGAKVKIHIPVSYKQDDEKNYLAMFQLKDSGENATTPSSKDTWAVVDKVAEATNGEFIFDFTFQKKRTTLGFTYYGTQQPDSLTDPDIYSDNAVDYLTPYVVTTGDNHSNLKIKHYAMHEANGMCVWKNRMCVWGTESSNNCLLLSDVDNFYYYPVPHNVALFDSSVLNCIPYKDTLLVFTIDKIYRVSENNDGTFTQAVIQNNMPLNKADAPYIVAIKNMVLFKSGNYFYMVVPKSQSLTDELTIAPIYKNIAGFLNTLDNSTKEVLQLMYPEYSFKECKVLNLAPVAVYSEQDTVHILYDVLVDVDTRIQNTSDQVDDVQIKNLNLSFKMFLNYNTNLRAWTLYFEDTTAKSLEVAALVETRTMSFVRILRDNSEGAIGLFEIVTKQPVVEKSNAFRILLDTGYRTLSSAIQKRFREIQIKLYSVSEDITTFGTAFLVDGVWRKNYSKLTETLIEDVDGKKSISLVPTLDLNTFITELTMPVLDTGDIIKNPGSDAIALSDWTLDFSHFKREAPTTVRIPISGKGYNPRFIFMTPDAIGITINEINWVYRLMHGR